jgi:hypothetical protein
MDKRGQLNFTNGNKEREREQTKSKAICLLIRAYF